MYFLEGGFIMIYEKIPNDPVMLLSFINLKLRDEYSNLAKLCKGLGLSQDELTKKLEAINYVYDKNTNQFK